MEKQKYIKTYLEIELENHMDYTKSVPACELFGWISEKLVNLGRRTLVLDSLALFFDSINSMNGVLKL